MNARVALGRSPLAERPSLEEMDARAAARRVPPYIAAALSENPDFIQRAAYARLTETPPATIPRETPRGSR